MSFLDAIIAIITTIIITNTITIITTIAINGSWLKQMGYTIVINFIIIKLY